VSVTGVRKRTGVAIGAAVLVAAIVAGALFPLLHDGKPKLSEGAVSIPGDGHWHAIDSLTPVPDGVETQLNLTYKQGKDATFAFSVRNDGGDPVKLVGASMIGAEGMFARRSVRFEPSPDDPRAVRAGRTVTLPAGKEVLVSYTGRFTGCGRYGPGSGVFSHWLTLLYGDGKKPKSIEISLRENVSIDAPRNCPEPRQP
jgi:hypothetical protein